MKGATKPEFVTDLHFTTAGAAAFVHHKNIYGLPEGMFDAPPILDRRNAGRSLFRGTWKRYSTGEFWPNQNAAMR